MSDQHPADEGAEIRPDDEPTDPTPADAVHAIPHIPDGYLLRDEAAQLWRMGTRGTRFRVHPDELVTGARTVCMDGTILEWHGEWVEPYPEEPVVPQASLPEPPPARPQPQLIAAVASVVTDVRSSERDYDGAPSKVVVTASGLKDADAAMCRWETAAPGPMVGTIVNVAVLL